MGRKQGRYTPHVAFLVFLIGVGLLWKFTMYVLQAPPSAQSEKLRRSQKMISYRVDQTRGARFRLSQTDNTVRLITHAILPKQAAAPSITTPDELVVYGVRLIAKIGDRVLWQHDIWSTSRQTKQPLPGGVMGEGAFVSDDSIELTDGRFTTVALPTMPQDAELWIYSTVETPVLVRILERRERSTTQVKRSEQLMDDAIGTELTAGRFLGTWSMLDIDEREELLQYRWNKLSAIGERNLDYVAISHYVMELPALAQDAQTVWPVTDRQWVSMNAYGPCRLTVSIEPAHGVPLASGELLVRTVGEQFISAWQTYEGPLELPPTFHSVWLRAARPGRVLPLTLAGCDDEARGGVTIRKGGAHYVDDATAVSFATGEAEADRTLRLDVRRLLAPGEMAEPVPFVLDVVFRDGAGNLLGRDELAVVSSPQFFDRAVPPPPLGGGKAPPAVEVSEPVSMRVVAPVGAASLEVAGSTPLLVRAYRYTGEPSAMVSTFELTATNVKWRGAPLSTRAWLTVGPQLVRTNQAAAPPARQAYTLHTAMRLQPVGMTDPFSDEVTSVLVPPTPLYSLRPDQGAVSFATLEQIAPSATWASETRATPGVAVDQELETEVPLDRAVVAIWPIETAQAPTLRCHVASVPALIKVSIDGTWYEKNQTVPRETWELMASASGDVTMQLAAPAEARCYINRRVRDGGLRVYRRRALYRWEPGETYTTTVRHDGATSIYAVVYAERADAGIQAATFELALRGGARNRLVGKLVASLTTLAKTLELPPLAARGDVIWLDRSGPAPTVGAAVRYGLGPDIRGGVHTVTWRYQGTKPVMVRFVSSVPMQVVAAPSVRRLELLGSEPQPEEGP
ncbi:MAG: hypothetical protein IPL79_15480 [Myxococcales bacterium]|nr:hypothetical protein [Myxococcales bacterium]